MTSIAISALQSREGRWTQALSKLSTMDGKSDDEVDMKRKTKSKGVSGAIRCPRCRRNTTSLNEGYGSRVQVKCDCCGESGPFAADAKMAANAWNGHGALIYALMGKSKNLMMYRVYRLVSGSTVLIPPHSTPPPKSRPVSRYHGEPVYHTGELRRRWWGLPILAQ